MPTVLPNGSSCGNSGHALSHSRVRDIYEDSRGNIWLGTDGGINLYDRKHHTFSHHRLTDSTHRAMANWVYSIIEEPADSTLWMAGYLGGIFVESLDRFRSEGRSHTADRLISPADGLPNEYIGRMLRDDRGNKWILNFRDTALTRIDGSTGRIDRVPLSGLSSNNPEVMCTDAAGRVWVGFYGGVAAFSPDGSPLDSLFRFPLGSDQSISAMAAVGPDIWIATQNAVWSLDPSSGKMSMVPLPEVRYSVIYYDPLTSKAFLGANDMLVVAEPAPLLAQATDERIEVLQVVDRGRTLTIDQNSGDGFRMVEL